MSSIAFLLLGASLPTVTAIAPFSATFLVKNLENGGSGEIVIDVHPEWAPKAAERFSNMLQQNMFDGMRFFHVVTGGSAHFGIPGDPTISAQWKNKPVAKDYSKESNQRGRISFVDEGESTEMIINIKDNDFYDQRGYIPFAEVREGMFNIDRLTSKHGMKPVRSKAEGEGNVYLEREFPDLSYIENVELVEQAADVLLADRQIPALGDSATSMMFALGACFALVVLLWHFVGSRSDVMPTKV